MPIDSPILTRRFRSLRSIRLFSAALLCITGLITTSMPGWAISFETVSIGYHTQGSKLAVLKDVPESQNVNVVLYDPAKRNPKFPVLLGAVVAKIDNVKVIPQSTQQGPEFRTLLVDFSNFQQPGKYELRLEGSDVKSQPIQISDFLYWDNLKPVFKSFYYQRCGQDVESRQPEVYHLACHVEEASLLDNSGQVTDEAKDVAGGWHNGGDYTRYVTSTALSAGRLMALYELNPKAFKFFRMEYPLFEPGLGLTDDFHHEIKSGLDWLLTMQRRDGAVYRKVAGKQWPAKILPENDEQTDYIFGVSTQDTANFAAAMAMATRSFKKAELGYSIKTLLAAEKAWDFLEAHPQTLTVHSDLDFAGSGEFLDPQAENDAPYRLWAASELYLTTGKEKYYEAFLSYLKEVPVTGFSWRNPSIQGMMDYLLYAHNPNETVVKSLKSRIASLANQVASDIDNNVWPSGLKQYPKSSNLLVVERAALLVNAYKLTGQVRYRDTASRSISYLYGINPLGMTYVTGAGAHAVAHPAMRWMESSEKTLPGYLVDGPNEAANDGKTPKNLGARSYIDNAKATAVNESTLLNNAGLVYLLGSLNDSYNTATETAPSAPSPLNYELAPERPVKKGSKSARPKK